MSWDWQVFCQDTITQEVGQSCFGKNGDITYLDWMMSAWGWTVSVALLSLVIALVLGGSAWLQAALPDPRLEAERQGFGWLADLAALGKLTKPVVYLRYAFFCIKVKSGDTVLRLIEGKSCWNSASIFNSLKIS